MWCGGRGACTGGSFVAIAGTCGPSPLPLSHPVVSVCRCRPFSTSSLEASWRSPRRWRHGCQAWPRFRRAFASPLCFCRSAEGLPGALRRCPDWPWRLFRRPAMAWRRSPSLLLLRLHLRPRCAACFSSPFLFPQLDPRRFSWFISRSECGVFFFSFVRFYSMWRSWHVFRWCE
jgi:hypothetical protein